MKSKAYRAVDVNHVDVEKLLQRRVETEVHVGLDVGKESIYACLRWSGADFERPWRVRNPFDLVRLAELLKLVARGRRLIVAMEPTGTYGDPLRQMLQRHGLVANRVSPKMAKDFAEVFDGVPSQHDGKDAGVIAELSAQGRSWPWPMPVSTEIEQELAYHVDWLDAQRRQMMLWCGRVEALLSRHWPEATRLVKPTSGTLLQCLATYGGPQGLAAAADALERVRGWSRHFLTPEKAQALVDSARTTVGVVMGPWDEKRLRSYAQEIQKCRRETRAARQRVCNLTRDHVAIRAMAEVVGGATACVLWVELGDPREYHCGPAYRKAMGLNHGKGSRFGKG